MDPALFALIVSAIGMAFALIALIAARRCALQAPPPCSCESRLESVQRTLAETQDSVLELANRVKMIKVRRAADHSRVDSELDGGNLKDSLRRKAGLSAGRPANHQ